MQLPEVARPIREKNYRVILDEAQDTDPRQFFVLLEISRSPEASGAWMDNQSVADGPPRPGHFCMVGDFQQSIYRDPADLTRYRELHDLLVKTHTAEQLKFSVTFRLDTAQLDFVNATFGEILNNQEGQVEFVEMNPRPDVLPGQVIRFDFGCDIDANLNEAQRAILEASELAGWLAAMGLKNLRAQTWKDVAILCPRKAWLPPLRDALIEVGLPVEVHSETDRQGENPAYAWLTALLAIMTDPNASYEIVGVLRDVFGLSDDELARFSQRFGDRFQIAQRTSGRGPVQDSLNGLIRIREAIAHQPPFTAVQEIVRATQLRERLRSLPLEEFGDLSTELDQLLGAVASAEARGLSLADFGQSLRTKFHATRETHPSPREAMQLITAHKAKGSEWQAVIVPFLTRQVYTTAPPYPRVIRDVQTGRAKILFDRTDYDAFDEQLKLVQRQEMERLLYVALTRARHTLVLAFDRDFFLNARGGFHSDSQIKWLRAGDRDCNFEIDGLALLVKRGNVSDQRQTRFSCRRTPSRKSRETTTRLDRRCSPKRRLLSIASARANSRLKSKFSPVKVRMSGSRSNRSCARHGSIALRRGTRVWWHELAQKIPWSMEPDTWQSFFEASPRRVSPDPARSRREWILLRNRISRLSDFPARFSNGKTIVHAEMPFFWKSTNPGNVSKASSI